MPSNAPFGFKPYRHLSGGVIRAREYPIATGYATALCTGDPVKLASDGTIELAAAGERILGVFQGVAYVDSGGNQVFTSRWPASTTATDIKASVIDDKNVSFRVQSGGTPAQTNVGNLADHVTGTGSAYTGQSAAYLNATMGTGAAGFRILGLIKEAGNSGEFAHVEVAVYEHEMSVDEPATPGV
ncbi:MAG TPA: hypothetical protein VEC14_12690 [Reyranellaceae bacterium]|nr:hypothetical protein [Reyranellaceae bacterium]